jgi:hypothetical protein
VRIMSIFYNGQFFCEARSDGTIKHDAPQDKINVSLCFASSLKVARELASHLRLKTCKGWNTHVYYLCDTGEVIRIKAVDGGEGTGFASAIEMPRKFTCAAATGAPRGWRRGEGTGFSSEIETLKTRSPICPAAEWRGNWLLI